jgi:peptidoglycan/LPS O-acetylase OafA/YrhL
MAKIHDGLPGSGGNTEQVPARNTTANYEGIQALRFVAALLVVITHSTFYATERLGVGGHVWERGVCGVDIFFVISGFVMVASTRKTWGRDDAWKVFALRRIIRIVPMYWLATTIKLAAVMGTTSLVLHSRPTLVHVLCSYLLIATVNVEGEYAPLLGVGWTLIFEMFFYAIFTFALFTKRNIFAITGPALVLIAAMSAFTTPGMPPISMYADPIVLEFLFGIIIAGIVTRPDFRFPPWAGALIMIAGIVAMLAITPQYYPVHTPRAIHAGIPAVLIIFGLVTLEPIFKGKIPRAVLILGDASYVLYLFHPLISPIAPVILHKLHIAAFGMSVVLSIAIALCVATAIHLSVERYATEKLRDYFFPRKNRARPAQAGVPSGTV